MDKKEEKLKKIKPIEPEVKTVEETTAPDQHPKDPPGTKK